MEKFDLTKQQVVDILADFEEKIPNDSIDFYIPSPNFNPRDPLSINVEASRMNNFLGLNDYSALVVFENLSNEHAAGSVDISNPFDRQYFINIDKNSLGDNAHVLKVLAHEICHKFLATKSMQKKLTADMSEAMKKMYTDMNEAMTELCTIYTGLGLLTLNGYNEHSGYLNLEDFCHAFCVVYKTRGMSETDIINIVPNSCKHYAVTILHDMAELEAESLSSLIISCQDSDYKFRRRLRLLQLIMDNIPEIKEKHRLQDGMFCNRQEMLKDGKHPIQQMLLRETIVQNNLSDCRLEKCSEEIDKLIDFLCSTLHVDIDKVSEGMTTDLTCPSCGHVSKKKRVDTVSVLKCPSCHHLFAWDGRPLTLPMTTKKEEVKKEQKSIWSRLMGFGKSDEEASS